MAGFDDEFRLSTPSADAPGGNDTEPVNSAKEGASATKSPRVARQGQSAREESELDRLVQNDDEESELDRLIRGDDPPLPRRSRSGRAGGLPAEEDQEDTNLDRPNAERRGGGGGPTKTKEEEDEGDEDEEEFKSDLLIKALGMEESPISIFGWTQVSFTGNPASPKDGMNFGVIPNDQANRLLLQQLYIVVERLFQNDDDQFDYGFRIDNLFGTDWQQFHAVGFFDGAFKANHIGYEPLQMYGELHFPVLTPGGLDVKVGRFFPLAGYETERAPARPLNSTSNLFAFSLPYTNIGVMTTLHVNDQLNIYNGAVNGFDNWLSASNRWGYSGGVSWDSKDSRTNFTVTFNWGPNQFPGFFPANFQLAPSGVTQPPFLAGRRNRAFPTGNETLFTEVLIHKFTEDFSLIMESDQGYETNVPGLGPSGTTQNGGWYGILAYLLYDFSDKVTGVYRFDAFRDQNGVRSGFNDTYYETTLGLIYKPRSWFWVRPEIRFDWANGRPPYNGDTSNHQFTLGADAIFLF